jgi:putative aldouronate transport system permease protein
MSSETVSADSLRVERHGGSASIASSRKKRSTVLRRLWVDIRQNRASYFLLAPAAIYVFIYGYIPLPYLLGAFQRYHFSTGLFGSEWVGLDNFRFFFGSNTAWQVTWNTLRLNVLFLLVGTVCAVFLAIILNDIVSRRKRFARGIQSVMIFPEFVSWMVVSHILYAFLATRDGIVNQTLTTLGLNPVYWYGTPEPWTFILVIVRVWKSVGIQTIIFLAAMAGFDPEIYQAAEIDGAGPITKAFRISVPMLLPVVFIFMLLALGRIFYADFGMIYAIVGDNGMLFPSTDVIDTYVFRTLRRIGRPGQAMAAGLYQSVVGFILVFGSNRLVKRFFPEGALF